MSTQPKTELVKIEMKAPLASGSNVQTLLEQYRRAFEIAAPKHLDINRVMRVAIMAVSRNRELLECTASSLLGAFMLSVQLGLDLGAKEAHLVPFKNKWTGQKEIQLIPDYRGVAKLIRNTGAVVNVRSNVVYKQDYFHYEEGLTPKLEHRPAFDHDFKDEDIIGAYCVAHFKEGYVEGHFVPRKYLDRVKALARSKTGPWQDHFAEMCRKTAMKHHSKTLPQDVNVAMAIELDSRAEMAKPQAIDVLQDIGDGRLIAEMAPIAEIAADDDSPYRDDPSDIAKSQPEAGKGALDTIVKETRQRQSRKSKESVAAHVEPGVAEVKGQSPPEAADLSRCDVDDFRDIETLAFDAHVRMSQVIDHVTSTMGVKPFESLPKTRKGEVVSWLQAQKR